MVVSVVTNDVSDDANGPIINNNDVYLRISGLRNAYTFHYSYDGKKWHFVRYFILKANNPVKIGFTSQSRLDMNVNRFYQKSSYKSTCMYYVFDAYCDCVEAQRNTQCAA